MREETIMIVHVCMKVAIITSHKFVFPFPTACSGTSLTLNPVEGHMAVM